MITYNPEERRSILFVLSEVMLADEVIHPKEKEFFDKMYAAIGANVSDLSTMEHIDSKYAKNIFMKMDKSKQKILSKALYNMAMADGYLDPREQLVLDFYKPTKE
jgi:uncharacterized tellurite resistance protein B-like protein